MIRPYVVSSVAVSVDGYIDDSSPDRLLLSNSEDFARVDELRASVDAILVGAGTVRVDNPRLLVRSEKLRQRRIESGQTESPMKVVVTGSGQIDRASNFFTAGTVQRIVYTGDAGIDAARALSPGVDVVDVKDVSVEGILEDLASRGVERLLVEGGQKMHTAFFVSGCVDELHLAVAPFFVGDSHAPRFVGNGQFPQDSTRPMSLVKVTRMGDVVSLMYRVDAS